MAEPLAIVPSLDEIAGDPSKARGLPASVVVDLLVRLDHVRAELHGEALRLQVRGNDVTARPTPPTPNITLSDDVRAYTTGELARRLGKSSAFVRDLCRSGRLQGATRKGKEWFIPIAAARAWLTPGAVDLAGSLTLPSPRDSERRETGAQVSRPVTIRIRRVARRPRGHGQEMGDGETRHASID